MTNSLFKIICKIIFAEGRRSLTLQYVDVPVIDRAECQSFYTADQITLKDDQICSGYSEGLKDACEVT